MGFHKTDGLYLEDCLLSMGDKCVNRLPHRVATVVMVGKSTWERCANIF